MASSDSDENHNGIRSGNFADMSRIDDDDFSDLVDDDFTMDDDLDDDLKERKSKQPGPAKREKKTSSSANKKRSQAKKTRASSKKKRAGGPTERERELDKQAESEDLTALGVSVKHEDVEEMRFYKKRPKRRNVRQWWIRTGYKSAVVVVPVLTILLVAAFWTNYQLNNKLNSQISATYNPSLRERNADLGKSAIYAYYNGDPISPVSIARGLAWPGGNEETSSYDDFSGDSAEDATGSSSIGTDASITATVRNLSLIKSEVFTRNGTEDEIRENPAMEVSQIETLTYSGIFNNNPVNISIMLQTPSPRSPQNMNAADNPQPPILVSLPTVTQGRGSLSGVAGSSDPGTRNGEFEAVREVPEQIKKSIDSWANAYVADDRRALRDVIQDPQDGNYVGMLGGWTMKEPTVKTQWQYRRADNLMVVGISFIASQAQNIKDDEGEDQTVVTDNPQMMEVLVDYSNGGTPAIVAWGTSGSAPHLKPYQNSLRDGEVPEGSGGSSSGGSSESTGRVAGNADEVSGSESEEPTGSVSGNKDEVDGGSSKSEEPSEDEYLNEDDFF